MLSRRCVRVKVMQLLYSMACDPELKFEHVLKRYYSLVEDTFQLFLLNLYTLRRITEVSIEDESNRKSKHLPTEEDKLFSSKIFNNEIVQSLDSNSALKKKFDKLNFATKVDSDFYKQIYTELSKTEEYKAYCLKDTDKADHLEMLLELYRLCRKHEYFNEVMEDNYALWLDDKSLVVGAVKKSLKALPAENEFYQNFYPEEETIKEFGEQLLRFSKANEEDALSYIKPVLENWDHDRLATIDTILLKMAITELIHFPTIPTNVSLNEYVEVSKMYSTPKSKDFINGILDRIMKKLDHEGRIKKEGRGLIN